MIGFCSRAASERTESGVTEAAFSLRRQPETPLEGMIQFDRSLL